MLVLTSQPAAMPDTPNADEYVAVAFATDGLKRPITHVLAKDNDGHTEKWSGANGVREALVQLLDRVANGATMLTFSGVTILEWHHRAQADNPEQRELLRELATSHFDLLVSFVAEHGHKVALNALLPEDTPRYTGADTASAVLRGDSDTVFTHLEASADAIILVYTEVSAGVVGYRTRAGKTMLWRTMGDRPGMTTLTPAGRAENKSGPKRLVDVTGMTAWCKASGTK